jgi:hypothetical protein
MIDDKDLYDAIAEIQQSRSNFQLNYFVIGQHHTPEMQYYQLLIELNDMLYKYKTAILDSQIQEIKIKNLRALGDEVSILESLKLELGMQQTKNAMLGTERELQHLYALWKSAPEKYTRAEIEAGQAEYWKARLTHDVEMQSLAGSVNPTHLGTMDQIGILEDFVSNVFPTKPNELDT